MRATLPEVKSYENKVSVFLSYALMVLLVLAFVRVLLYPTISNSLRVITIIVMLLFELAINFCKVMSKALFVKNNEYEKA